MFIHVPKTGGTSVVNTLKTESQFSWIPWSDVEDPLKCWRAPAPKHEPLFMLEQKNNLSNFYVFSTVRNPYTRTYSLYQHLHRAKDSPLEQVRKLCRMTFVEMLRWVKDDIDVLQEKHFTRPYPVFSDYISYTQSFFVTSTTQVIDKLYRFENLAELEIDFGIDLPKRNAGKYTQDEYYASYTSEAIDLVKEIYEKDFTNFGYSFDFQ